MKNKNLLLLLPAVLLSINSNSISSRILSKVNPYSVSKSYLTESQLNYYLINNNYQISYTTQNSTKEYTYTRYNLYDTRTIGDKYFLNIKVYHNADLADTNLKLQSITFFGLSHTKGFGYSTEVSGPGAYCSFASEMSLTTSTDTTITQEVNFTLKGNLNDNDNYDSSGTYYLYYVQTCVDAIIVKRDSYGNFIAAEYYDECPEESFTLQLIKERPTTKSTLLPTC